MPVPDKKSGAAAVSELVRVSEWRGLNGYCFGKETKGIC